jgi:DNA recombination protein RmuC
MTADRHLIGYRSADFGAFVGCSVPIQYSKARAPIMTISVVIFLTLAGLLAGYLFATLLGSPRAAALGESKKSLEQELATARAELARKQNEGTALLEAKARLEEKLDAERANSAEKLRMLTEARSELENSFKALASSALESNNSNFLELAKQSLANFHSEARSDLEAREKAVETLIKPIAESLKQVDGQVRELEKSRAEAYGTLTSQVASLLTTQQALQTETGNLVKALREPHARGRWGELQLRRVIELAGMLDFCDFQQQMTVTNDDRRYRPDVVVKLPGGKNIVIDSKAPLMAYLAALEAEDETTRAARLSDHARQIKQHIDNLAGKAYWAQFQPTPEFVVLFLPGEVFFRAALDSNADLLEYGVSQRVIVASPTTLIALLKAVAYGWNQKNLTESALKISEAGKALYERLCVMTRHFEDVGNRLGSALESYNKAVGSMQRSVFPVARKFPDLDKSLAAEELPDVQPLEVATRQLDAPDWKDGDGTSGLLFNTDKVDGAKA